MMKKLIGLALLSLTMMGVSYAEAVAEVHDPMASEILSHINRFRASHGLSPLVMNDTVSAEARTHSRSMANHAVSFGHDGFQQRLSHLVHTIPHATGGAENVAYNYKTAKIVADGWIHSPGHRQNILGHYNLTGIGIVSDRNGKLYYTQMFLRTDNTRTEQAHVHGHSSRRFYVTHG